MLRKKMTMFMLVAAMGVGTFALTGCGTDTSNASEVEQKKDEVKVDLYNVDGKTKIETLKVKSGEKVTPKEPKKDGYKFVAWYLNPYDKITFERVEG